MIQYHALLEDVLTNGVSRADRTGTGTLSVFGRQARFPVTPLAFPLITTKKIHWKSVVYELLWFLSGSTNVRDLQKNGVTIWDEWADETGDLGPVYGKQWRAWTSGSVEVDQIANLVRGLKENPYGRRHIVSAWNVADVDKMALPPCHTMFQFYVAPPRKDGGKPELSLQLYQRSADLFLGVPFNIASYALLLMMTAQVCGYEPCEFIHTFGDLHLYKNHLEQAKLQLGRGFRSLPCVLLNEKRRTLEAFTFSDIALCNYNPHPAIKAEVSV